MAVAVSYQPQILDFTTASIGLVQISHAPADAVLVASIVAGNGAYKVDSVVVYDVTIEVVDPGDLPPGHKGPPPKHTVYTEVGRSDGSTPLFVAAGQFIEARVLSLPFNGVPITDTVAGLLLIQGDTWNPKRSAPERTARS